MQAWKQKLTKKSQIVLTEVHFGDNQRNKTAKSNYMGSFNQ